MPIRGATGNTTPRIDDKGDWTHVPLVQVEGGITLTPVTTQAIVDRELVQMEYFVKTAFPGASVNDRIVSIRAIDTTTGVPISVWTIWHNATTGSDLGTFNALTSTTTGTVPNLANLSSLRSFTPTVIAVNVGASYTTTAGCASVTVIPSTGTTSYSVAGQAYAGSKIFSLDGNANLLGPMVINAVVGGYVSVMEVK